MLNKRMIHFLLRDMENGGEKRGDVRPKGERGKGEGGDADGVRAALASLLPSAVQLRRRRREG